MNPPVKKIPENRGLVKMIVLIVIGLLILSYLGFNLRHLADSPTTKDNFSYVINLIVHIWDTYLKGPVVYVWNVIFIPYIWNPIFHHLQTSAVKP